MTNQEADKAYKAASAALSAIIRSDDATDEEREAATEKRTDLTMNFIGKAIEEIGARTARFQQFINEMEDLIKKFDPDRFVDGIVQLQGVVDEAAKLVKAATTDTATTTAAPATRGGPIVTPARAVPVIDAPSVERAAAAPTAAGGTAKRAAKPVKRAAKPKPSAKKPTKAGATTRKPAAKKPSAKKRPPARKPVKRSTATNSATKRPATRKPAARRPK